MTPTAARGCWKVGSCIPHTAHLVLIATPNWFSRSTRILEDRDEVSLSVIDGETTKAKGTPHVKLHSATLATNSVRVLIRIYGRSVLYSSYAVIPATEKW